MLPTLLVFFLFFFSGVRTLFWPTRKVSLSFPAKEKVSLPRIYGLWCLNSSSSHWPLRKIFLSFLLGPQIGSKKSRFPWSERVSDAGTDETGFYRSYVEGFTKGGKSIFVFCITWGRVMYEARESHLFFFFRDNLFLLRVHRSPGKKCKVKASVLLDKADNGYFGARPTTQHSCFHSLTGVKSIAARTGVKNDPAEIHSLSRPSRN